MSLERRAKADAQRRGRVCTPLLRQRVRAAFDLRCEYCGTKQPPDAAPQQWHGVDRIVPGFLGGLYVPGNVTLACKRCNSAKSFRHKAPASVRTLADMERVAP